MRILYAEDEKSLSKAVCAILKKNNYEVDAVYDGEEAYDYLSAGENYDIAILDIMMPKMDGVAVLKKIRAEGNNIPVIMLTAKSEIDDKVTGLDSGANDYLTKPFESKELLARIRVLARSTGVQTTSKLTVGNISLDSTTFELTGPSGAHRLSGKEYQLLELLMSNPGSVISTERFLEKVWGYDTESDVNVVWVYISYLRKKLESIGASVAIKAKRNVGYALEEIK